MIPILIPISCSWNATGDSEVSVHSSDQEYWAKGTGFGSGSLRSGWNMDQVRERQKKSERQVELMFKVRYSTIMNIHVFTAYVHTVLLCYFH